MSARRGAGTQFTLAAYLGDRLGYYRALADGGPASSPELAQRTGTAERYAGSVRTGTVMRPDGMRRYARDAGFSDVEVLPVENEFFRFYRLR